MRAPDVHIKPGGGRHEHWITAAGPSRLPGVRHAFTTRSRPDGERPLTLARRPGLSDERLREDWAVVAGALDPSLGADDVALLEQVHGADVVEVLGPGGPLAPVARADAAWTSRPGTILAVRTADCVPVLVMGPNTVAVAHAGWRGVAGRVVPALVEALTHAGERADALVAIIGPAISGAVYEVGDEVVEGLRAAGLAEDDFLFPSGGPRPHVDLTRAVGAQLRGSGVTDVSVTGICTLTDARMHSFRRDGAASGRQAGVIVRLP